MLLGTISSACLLFAYGKLFFGGQVQHYILNLSGLADAADIVIDPLAAFFGMLFAFGYLVGIIYAHFYLKTHSEEGNASHLFFTGLMIISMHLVLMLRHSLLFMIAWELMSLSSFFAIMQDRQNKESIANALYYFVMMHIGAAVLLLGFALQFASSGSPSLVQQAYNPVAKWLLLAGFAFKAGFFPFYSWLPKAHPVAPAHLSGMMSGLMIKTGIFGIMMILMGSSWQPAEIYILLGISLFTAFNGVIHAMAESNIKRSLAYSSIENIGIIGVGLSLWLLGKSLGNPSMSGLGLMGATLHIMNHSLFKPLLFYLSGNVLVATHSLETDTLGGLIKRMPITAMLFLLGTGSISALPLFNGFISELAIFLGIISGFQANHLGGILAMIAAGGALAFVSALALIAFSKMFSIVFSGEPRSSLASNAKELPFGMLLSPMLLAAFCFCFGIFGELGLLFVKPLTAALQIDSAVIVSFAAILHKISTVLLMLLAAFIALHFIKQRLVKIAKSPTWGCGYQQGSAKQQYTGTAYINPLAYFLRPFMQKQISRNVVEGYFPQSISHAEEVQDYVDKSIISKLLGWLTRFYRLFDGIHNGKTNSYISYLLIALLCLLFWVLGVQR
jgi:formate hydrogenlyase subunit 3/multisubunit Na+/H+ antiporter MnhD subunit